MRYYLLLAFFALSTMRGVTQPVHSLIRSETKPPHFPTANQFEHLSTDDGLSNNSVTAILQDRAGFMWFGTREGLNKYDGHTFTIFRPNSVPDKRSFQDSYIRGLCEGDSHTVWAVTERGGLHEVDTRTGRVTPHPIQVAQASRWNHQSSVYQDSQHGIWVSTLAGIARYEPTRHQFTLYPIPGVDLSATTVFEDRQHRFWVATLRGLYLLNRETGKFMLVPVPGLTGSQPYMVSIFQDKQDRLWIGTASPGYSLLRLNLHRKPWHLEPYNPGGQLSPYVWRNTIHQDSTGIIWLGTTNGLYAIDPATDKVVTYQTDINLLKGLASSNASAVYHDRSGMLWVGTDNGIDRQGINTKAFTNVQVKPNPRQTSLPENRVNALFLDSRNQLWISNATGVYRQSPGQGHFLRIPPENFGSIGGHTNTVSSFLADGPDGLWFGTWDGLYYLNQTTGRYTHYPAEIPAQFISLHREPNGNLWLGGEGGFASFNRKTHQYTYYKYKPGTKNGLPDKDVYGLIVSQLGEVWVLVNQLGICRLNIKSGVMTHFSAGPKGHLSSNNVLSIYEDKTLGIWIGTHLGGLNRFDFRTGLFSVITPQQGIPGNSIVGITGDESGMIWLSTDEGLCRVDPGTITVHAYTVKDGLMSQAFMHHSVFRQREQLYFGSENGVVQFDPSRLYDDTRPFPVCITSLSVLDKPRPMPSQGIRLKHDENMVSFGFAALSYAHPEQNQYAYQLTGVNKNWVQNGNRSEATYTSLAPGTYTFRVKAANSNGFWTKNQATYQVIVEPPWWATWWAYSLYALLAGGAIWGYIRFYTNRLRQQQEQVLNRREAEQLKALDALKTHFFANITHEFRTPLSLIIGPVDKMLLEDHLDRPMLTTVRRNASTLLRLINQLLDLSKLEGNNMPVSLVQGDMPEFITQLVYLFQPLADQKGVTLTCTIDTLPPNEVVFDADKWEKILTNLLANAIKFTPRGGQVSLNVAPVLAGSELAGVQLELADSGIGIAPDVLPHIFDRFYQADMSGTRTYGGTGIGLSLVKELVDLLGGTLSVTSQPAVGTTFLLTLPVQTAQLADYVPPVQVPTHATDAVSPLPYPPLTQPLVNGEDIRHRLLIVEDNDELRAFLVNELSSTYTVIKAVDGVEGWAMVQAELPDLVLTDVMMPGMDGHQLTHCIKTHTETDHIAVVMLTAKSNQQSRIEGLRQGADDYLSKPFSVAELHLRLHNLISRQQKLAAYYRQQFALPTAVYAEPEATKATVTDPFLTRIYGLLDGHLDDDSLGVDWLADQLAMNRKTLYRKVQSLIQLSPADLIRQYRLRKAAELLRSGRNVSETADLTGFSTASHLTSLFRESYGQTPTEFMANRA
jgi:signal transduction histidine kinase/ligand-binding sensor domain-containing protein/DNA-binding response OmpR family regulator